MGSSFSRRLLFSSLAALATGCSGGAKVSMSARTGALKTTGALTQGLTAGGSTTLTRVRMVVQRIELEAASAAVDGGEKVEGQGAAEVDELASGPYLIDLSGSALEGGISRVFTVDAQPGEYRKLKFRIHKLEEAEAVGNPAMAEMKKLSVRVEGTRNGNTFSFDSSLDEEQEREGKFTLGAGENNIALNIDASKWFEKNGAALDPSDSANRSTIESNIKASLDAFDDDNSDGEKDD